MTHEHDWKPADGERAAYRCDCGALGRRDVRSGKITFAKRPLHDDWSARPQTWTGGLVKAKPDADHQGMRG